jgi:hypothetical protein
MNFELKSNTSIEINERQDEVQLPPIWKMQNNLQTTINELGKIKLVTSKNQDHPLLNYLLKSTPSKLKKNLMLFVEKLEQV